MRSLLAIFALAVTATITTHSLALPPWPIAQAKTADWKTKQDARKAYASGKSKIAKSDFAGALEDFRKADSLVPGAAPKFQIAVCLDKLGKTDEAVAAYRAFLDMKPGEKYATEMAEAQRRLSEIEATLDGKVTLTIAPADAPGINITVDGNKAEGAELTLKPGNHTIVVSATGYQEQTQTVEVKGGATAELTFTLQPSTAPAPVPVPEPDGDEDDGGGSGLVVAGFVVLGIAVVAGIITTVFGVQALNAKSDFDATPTEDLANDAEDKAVLADVFLGVAGGTAIIGAVLIVVGASQNSGEGADKEEGRPSVIPYAGPNGAGGVLTWKF